MGLVGKVIKDKVHGVNGLGIYTYDDLFQIGCIGLCKAAATDKGGCFSTLRLPAYLERDLLCAHLRQPPRGQGDSNGAGDTEHIRSGDRA